ncbi:MAG: glutamine--tRNA ligase, partial [bacterium]|nr:glutamine--tRNA ligase [bacterium]
DLNKSAGRVMAVLRPLKIVIDNYPEGKVEMLEAENNPEDPASGTREIPFSREVYIEWEDFREDPPKKYFRLSPGREIRLKHAYYIKCERVVKDESGNIVQLHCTYDPASRGGWTDDGRKVRGTSHWVSAAHALKAEVRMYERLFTEENPDENRDGKTFRDYLNPDSLNVLTGCLVEPGLADVQPGERYQFLRQGYFCVDLDS